tara:strand:+ start:3054 stop:3218 length:165 start_codon:yes stop_codon:yes gene_type:complete
MTKNSLPGWKVKALQDPSVNEKQARIIMDGPKCLTDAWFLSAMYFKYQTHGIND